MFASFVSIASFASMGWLTALSSPAQARPLSRADIARLAPRAPEASAARARAEGSRAAASEAAVLSTQNPSLSVQAGPRIDPGVTTFALNAAVAVPVDIFGQRAARIEAAQAQATASVASARKAALFPLHEALSLHAEALATQARADVFARRLELVMALSASAKRRKEAGEVAENDVALVRLQVAREKSLAAQLQGEARSLALRLAAVLALPEGETADAVGPLVPIETTATPVGEPATVALAEAQRAAAVARVALEEAAQRPTVSLIANYQLDDGGHIITGGLSIPFALYGINDAEVATARGEARAAEIEVAGARRTVRGEIAALRVRVEATARALEEARPASSEAREIVGRAQRAYAAGESDLPALLLIRREALDSELGVIDAELAHARAKIDLLLLEGRWAP